MAVEDRQDAPPSSPAELAAGLIRRAHRVWDDKAIGLISGPYAHAARMYEGGRETRGAEALMAGAVRTLAAFPDLRVYGDEVIWEDAQDGLLLSHRFTLGGHHLGHGAYGPPSGRRVRRSGIVQQLVVRGRVREAWAVHDETALIRQLGLDPAQLAREAACAEADLGLPPPDAGHVGAGAVPGPLGAGDAPGELPGLLCGVWNARMLHRLQELYAPDAVIWAPGGRRFTGPAQLAASGLQLLAAFSDGSVHVEQVTCQQGAGRAHLAVRWHFQGTHDGPGVYGAPRGRRVRVPGLSHLTLQGGLITRDHLLLDEFALLKQLHWPV